MDATVQRLLTELEAGLRRSLRQTARSGLGLSDELQHWVEVATTNTQLVVRERAHYFQEELQRIAPDFANIHSLSLLDLLELTEKTQEVLDSLWKQDCDEPYQQERMQVLIQVGVVCEHYAGDSYPFSKHTGCT